MYLPLEFAKQVDNSIQIINAPAHVSATIQQRLSDFVDSRLESQRDEWLYDCVAFWRLASDEWAFPLKKGRYRLNKLAEEFERDIYGDGIMLGGMSREDMTHCLLMTSCVHEWMKCKRAYKIEGKMFDTLCEMKIPEKIFTDVVQRLPIKSFYIDCNASHFGKGIEGFIVTLGVRDGFIVFDLMCLVRRTRIIPMHITLGVDTLSPESYLQFDRFSEHAMLTLEDGYHISFNERGIVKFLFNLILYLSASNRDVVVTERTKKEHKPTPAKSTKYQMREVEEYGVGFRYAQSISKSVNRVKYVKPENSVDVKTVKHDKNRPKRGYSSCYRSAHWHHYWVKDGEGKKLIVKWIDGSFVRGNRVSSDVVIQKVVE